MNVFWTATAEAHLETIYAYTAHDSEADALSTVDNITRRSQQIGDFPASGRKVPEYDIAQIREVLCSAYRIIYYIKPDQIDVLAVLHASMNRLESE